MTNVCSTLIIMRINGEALGWALALLIPACLLLALRHTNLNWACTNFMVIFSAALVMWVFRLVPEYTPAVFIILATMLLGLAPQAVLLSGFASDSFFLALSIFGIGAVIVKSKLFLRGALLLLSHLPQRLFLFQGALFAIGAMLTPVMTTQSARVALITPLLDDINQSAGFKPKSDASNSLACCAYNGCILLSVIFLTGKSSNFVLFGMLPAHMQWQYNWLNWLVASLFPAFLLIVVFFIVLRWQFRRPAKVNVSLALIKDELARLGEVSRDEYAALISILVLIVGLFTSSWHHISAAWFSFAIFFILMTSGILSKQDFKNRINWPFLFYLGAIIGIMRCVQEIGIDKWIIESLSWLSLVADSHTFVFIVLIYVLGWAGSLFFGTVAAPALLFTVLLPIAQHAGFNAWLVAFVLLMSTEAWLFPYQASHYLCFEELAGETKRYSFTPTLRVNAYFNVLRLGVILVSIPYWKMLGVL